MRWPSNSARLSLVVAVLSFGSAALADTAVGIVPDDEPPPSGAILFEPQGDGNDAVASIGPESSDASATVTLSAAQGPEGNAGTNTFLFTLGISGSLDWPFAGVYRTRGAGEGDPRPPGPQATATPFDDYNSVFGSFSFSGPGQRVFAVEVNGDTVVEPDEFFYFEISSLHHLVFLNNVGLILNDDAAGNPPPPSPGPAPAPSPGPIPAPPSNLTVPVPAAVDGSTLTVSWTTPQTDPADPIVSYTVAAAGQITVVTASDDAVHSSATRSVTLSGVDRSVPQEVTVTAMTTSGRSSSASTTAPALRGRIFVSNAIASGPAAYDFAFGPPGAAVVTGDWSGDGHTGFAARSGNIFTLVDERGVSQGSAAFGKATDEVFIGDWNANGLDTFGVRRSNVFFLRNTPTGGVADIVLGFGRAGDEVFVGDWNGNGQDTFAVRRGNVFFVRNSTTTGVADVVFGFGRSGDEVLVGDWDQDGLDSFAVRRGNTIFIRNDFQTGIAQQTISFGKATDQLLVGDYDNDGVDTFAVRRLEAL
ncbi:MAG: fibronectin type III domain-containing protein [Acidimicrobiia bacterium]|nr:fibronectin type III domain-containing protein [Acidimicrobiia bacterium]